MHDPTHHTALCLCVQNIHKTTLGHKHIPEAWRHHFSLLGAASTEDLAAQTAVVTQPCQGLERLVAPTTGGGIAAHSRMQQQQQIVAAGAGWGVLMEWTNQKICIRGSG
jgi:hypothetical protein